METKIFDYGMNGEGVGKVNGKITLIPCALIDEIVEFEVENENSNYLTAKNVVIKEMSKERVIPKCKYYGICGGCDLQHMSENEQCKFKKLLVKKTIKKIAGVEVFVEDVVTSNKCFAYRNKLSLNISESKIGFFKNNTKEIVEVEKCLLADDKINLVIHIFKSVIGDNLKVVKNLVIRFINNQLLVGVVTK